MKALSLTQPWASLVAFGEKQVETRSWSPPYRGIIAIHASKRIPKEDREFLLEDETFTSALARHGVTLDDLPLGCVVATARLYACIPSMEALDLIDGDPGIFPENEEYFGNFAPGRFAWMFANVRPLPEPIPAKGSLGLWEFDESLTQAWDRWQSRLILSDPDVPAQQSLDLTGTGGGA